LKGARTVRRGANGTLLNNKGSRSLPYDTNPVQFSILKLLVNPDNGNDSSFWICGDDAQSIYGFTGASVGNILNFKSMFPESEQIILNLNYRSTPQILRACQNLIRHNEKQIQKALETMNADGDDVSVLESSSEETEALTVVNEINELIERQGFKHSDIAVLYRANFQSRYLEETFQQHKIPYHITNGQCFYDRKEVKVLLDYLRVISNPNSDDGNDALVNIINVPNRYIGRKFIQELKDFSIRRGVHLYEGLKSMGIDLVYVRKNVREFVSFMDPLIDDAGNLMPSEVIQLLRSILITTDTSPTRTSHLLMMSRSQTLINCNSRLQDTVPLRHFLNIRNPFRTSMYQITRTAFRL